MTNVPKIKYSKKWFNPLFFILEDIIENKKDVKRILIYGGKSSAKTLTVAQVVSKYGLEKRYNSILFRKETARVKGTIKRSLKKAIDSLRLQNGFDLLDFEARSKTGCEIFLTGLDSEDKAKGVEGFNFVLFDELDQYEYTEYSQTNLSLRGEGRKIFFCTWNPVSKNSWVKKQLVDSYQWLSTDYSLPNKESFVKISSCGTTILIKTNYKDNYWSVGSPCGTYGFRDESLIKDYEKLKKTDYNAYKINVLGEWGNVSTGGEFYKQYRTIKHTVLKKYRNDLPIHISLDENVNPYVSLSIYQAEGLISWKIDEICLEHPKNTLKDTLIELYKRYPPNRETIYVYGDRTSLKADTKLEKGQNFFTIVEKFLKEKGYIYQRRLPSRNPSVTLRGNFINEIFSSNIYGIDYKIGENCHRTIDDYENVKEDSDGTKKKSTKKHPITKVVYQEYGHLTDTDDYFICEYYKEQYNEYIGKKKPEKPKPITKESLGLF